MSDDRRPTNNIYASRHRGKTAEAERRKEQSERDKREIPLDRSVDLGDGVFWAMDLDRYELRDSTDRVYFFMLGDAVRGIQVQEEMDAPKQAFIFGLYLRTSSGEWVLKPDS